MRAASHVIFVAGLFLSTIATASELSLPNDVYGRYAPSGDCGKLPRINVDETGVHLDTAAGKRSTLPINVSYTWAGGASYTGIQTWALVKHGGKNRWGEDNQPVILTFNAHERRGALTAERTGSGEERPVALDGPLTSIVQTGTFRLCTNASATSARPAARQVTSAIADSPAASFASVINALMQPATVPAGSYYDWRFIEKAPNVTWAALPPEMLDKPLADGQFFRRTGTVTLGSQSLKVMAAGARTMVFNHYFKNEGRPLGEEAVLAALRGSGLEVTTARCAMNKNLRAPTWYRLSGNDKRTALLWIAQPRGAASPWEGFNLSLDNSLKPLTPQERTVYSDRCA